MGRTDRRAASSSALEDVCKKEHDGRYSCWPASGSKRADGDNSDAECDIEILRIAAEHFRHDIDAFWSHSSFFLVIQGALVTVLATIATRSGEDTTDALLSPHATVRLISVLGLLSSASWAWVAYQRCKLIEAWRDQVVHLDGLVDRHGIYRTVETQVSNHRMRDPTQFTALLPLLLVLFWTLPLILLV